MLNLVLSCGFYMQEFSIRTISGYQIIYIFENVALQTHMVQEDFLAKYMQLVFFSWTQPLKCFLYGDLFHIVLRIGHQKKINYSQFLMFFFVFSLNLSADYVLTLWGENGLYSCSSKQPEPLLPSLIVSKDWQMKKIFLKEASHDGT